MYKFILLLKKKCLLYFRTTVEQLQNEVQTMDNRIQKIKKQVELPSTEIEIKNQMRDFLQVCFLSFSIYYTVYRL